MAKHEDITRQYSHGSLAEAIAEAVAALGKSPESVSVDDLAPVDEFHIGGRRASEDFLVQLALTPEHHVVDVGCGLGGAARFTADRFGCRVSGIDLTDEYVQTGRLLSQWVGLDERIALHQGSALSMPFGEGDFDAAYMIHVGMNIADKARLFSEVHRVLKPDATFGIYDVMQTGAGELAYPVPWADTAEANAIAGPEQYKAMLEAAGFTVTGERDRRGFALEFFDGLRARLQDAGGPPPLGLHILMGESTGEKVANMVANISCGRIAPIELIARK